MARPKVHCFQYRVRKDRKIVILKRGRVIHTVSSFDHVEMFCKGYAQGERYHYSPARTEMKKAGYPEYQ